MSVAQFKCATCAAVSTQSINVVSYGHPRCPCCGGSELNLAHGGKLPEEPPIPAVIDAARGLYAFLKPGTVNRSASPTPNELAYFTLMDRLGEALEKLDVRASDSKEP